MAPRNNSSRLNKRSFPTNVPSAEKDPTSSRRCKKRMKKLPHKLGPKWSNKDLERFYEAYRKYGKDWKKVASSVYDRSIEMVEALYNMNRSYLSLPEGAASIVGLTALMADYYDVKGGSDSERESYDASGFQKLPNANRGKVQMSVSNKDHLTTHSVAASADACLCLGVCMMPRAVRKRTCIPISYSNKRDQWENCASENKSWQKSEFDVSNDEAAYVAALALTEASKRRGSPSTSGPCKINENMKSSHEVSGRRKGGPNEDYVNGSSSLGDIECVRTDEAHHKMKKRYREEKVIDDKNSQSHDSRLEASNMDAIRSPSVQVRKVDTEISNAECELLSPPVQKKKSSKLLCGDEKTALDALQTLADVCLTMSYTAIEPESSVQLVEETESFNLEDKSCIPEATLSAQSRDKVVLSEGKQISIEDTSSGKSKPGRGLSIDVVSKKKVQLEHPSSTYSSIKLIPDTKVHGDVHLCEHLKTEGTSEHIKPMNNENQVTLPVKQQGSRSRRKVELQKLLTPQKTKSCNEKLEKELVKYSTSMQDRAFFLKDKLCGCMSSTMVRRWCVFEWFYSALDYPWFAKREFVEYLDHVDLENIPWLTRVEWGVVRSSLGKPRRFSEHFLRAERMKLKHYRESVRQCYAELRSGVSEGLPIDFPRPLSVGQRVIALHPNTREVHDGSVLRVYPDKCWILFDKKEIGVRVVMDIDCMPSNPMDCMSESLRRQSCKASSPRISDNLDIHCMPSNPRDCLSEALRLQSCWINKLSLECEESQANLSRELEKTSNPHISDTLDIDCMPSNPRDCMSEALKSQSCSINKLSLECEESQENLSRELEKASSPHISDTLGIDCMPSNPMDCMSEALKSQSCSINKLSLECEELQANLSRELEKASSPHINDTLVPYTGFNLKQHNTCSGNSLPLCPKPPRNTSAHKSIPCSFIVSQESGCRVDDIVKRSRKKAQLMVNAAIQALSSTKKGDNPFPMIWSALHSFDDQKSSSGYQKPSIKSQDHNLGHFNQFCSSELLSASDSSSTRLRHPDKHYAGRPSDLIISCVAAFLMIQACTKHPYPPGDVARMLGSAVQSLLPRCSQNLHFYNQIETYIGKIQNQLFSIVPT